MRGELAISAAAAAAGSVWAAGGYRQRTRPVPGDVADPAADGANTPAVRTYSATGRRYSASGASGMAK